jgi:hypothetical protein
MNEAVEFEERDFANAFAQQSPFRGPPTPELESSWNSIWEFGGISIPADKFPSYNRSNEREFQRVPPEKGGGYAAMIEGFHQLHCLVSL